MAESSANETREEPRQQGRQLDALFRVNNFMSKVTDLRHLLTDIMNESKAVVGAEASALMLYDEQTDELFFEVALGEKGAALKQIRLKATEGIAGDCAQRRETIVVEDVATDTRHARRVDEKSAFQTRNLIATPMIRGERLIGVLEVLNKQGGESFTADDVKIIQFFADQASIAVENAILVQRSVQNERLAAVGEAILSLSHYIKNILAGMKGSAGLIEMGLEATNIGVIREAWPIVNRSQLKITNLVQDMLTYSKEREPDYSEISIADMLRDVAETISDTAKGAKVSVEVQVKDAPPRVELDEVSIHDAILNMVVNAIDACRGLPGAEVVLRARPAGPGMFAVEVEDNGGGIPEQIRARIFDAFFSTKGSKGTGLGLAVAKKVVEEHKGRLDLSTEEGEGTRFTLILPIRKPEKQG